MKPTTDYNATQAASNTVANTAKLPAGGYSCKILKAEADEKQFFLYFDIAEGDFKGYFMNQFETKKKFDDNTRYKGIYRQFVYDKDGKTNPYFKGLLTAIEDSNPGYKWDWNEKGLKGKAVGVVFREEAWEYNGYSGVTAKPFYCCKSCDAPAMPVPKPKASAPKQPVTGVAAQMVEYEDESLPF